MYSICTAYVQHMYSICTAYVQYILLYIYICMHGKIHTYFCFSLIQTIYPYIYIYISNITSFLFSLRFAVRFGHTGVAFETRLASYASPNRTLASGRQPGVVCFKLFLVKDIQQNWVISTQKWVTVFYG